MGCNRSRKCSSWNVNGHARLVAIFASRNARAICGDVFRTLLLSNMLPHAIHWCYRGCDHNCRVSSVETVQMKQMLTICPSFLAAVLTFPGHAVAEAPPAVELRRPTAITMDELSSRSSEGVSVVEVSDYVFGGYRGPFPSPPCADLNPKKALVIFWKDFSFRFVFAHEGSYCPWFEFPSGAAACYQFFEGNDGWAELFNQWGRQERNSFVDVIESGPKRVWVRWTYFGVNMEAGQPAYRATEDFWAYPNGLILRRQTYRTLLPGQHHGYAREPIELIGMCPVGQRWIDVLRKEPTSEERHALSVLDIFTSNRYDVYWRPKPDSVWDSTHRRTGCTWEALDDAAGVALVLPLKDGSPFCVFGDASGFRHDYTRIKEHTHPDTGGTGWGSQCWDHWPIGWLNSQAHVVDADSLKQYPNHFSPVGMDFFNLPNELEEQGIYYSMHGVGSDDMEAIRQLARQWLEQGTSTLVGPDSIADLPAPAARNTKLPAGRTGPG